MAKFNPTKQWLGKRTDIDNKVHKEGLAMESFSVAMALSQNWKMKI